MSSYINSPKHFNSIEIGIRDLILYSDRFCIPYDFKERFPLLHGGKFKTTTQGVEQSLRAIMDTLRQLQPLCVTLQYKDHYVGVLDREIEEETAFLLADRKTFIHLSPLGLYNAINCLKYQIETRHLKQLRELNEAEENALWFIENISDVLAHYIVSELPEDQTNRWSIE